MARRRGTGRSFVGSNRVANRSWSSLVNTGVTLVAPDAKVLLGSFALNNAGIDETVLRTVFVTGPGTAVIPKANAVSLTVSIASLQHLHSTSYFVNGDGYLT